MNGVKNKNYFKLKQKITPYLGIPIIFLVFSPLLIWGVVVSHDWNIILIPVPGFIIFVGILILIGVRYQVCWQDGIIIQKASNGSITKINVKDIKSLVNEISDTETLMNVRRPFRRITVYGNTHEGLKYIDISLRHFDIDDIRKLVQMIHKHRPDLLIPNI